MLCYIYIANVKISIIVEVRTQSGKVYLSRKLIIHCIVAQKTCTNIHVAMPTYAMA